MAPIMLFVLRVSVSLQAVTICAAEYELAEMGHFGGLTGRITTLLAQAAELAIRQKTECINLDLLDQAASAGIFRMPAEEEADDALA